MSEPTGSTSERLTTAHLLAVATETDPSVTTRRLEFWRNEGLLPHPERTGQAGTRPVWTYPPETVGQLQALLRLRETTKDPDVLRAALWFGGYPVPTALARAAIIDYIREMCAALDRVLQRQAPASDLGDDEVRSAALEQVARVLARKRGKSLPRHERQSQQDRDRAVFTMLGLALNGSSPGIKADEQDAAAVEGLLGMSAGRKLRIGDAGPWLSGPAADGLADFAKYGSIVALIDAVESIDDAALELARTNARLLLHGVSFAARLADAFTGRPNVTGMTALAEIGQSPEAGIWFTALLASLGRSPTHADSVAQIAQALAEFQAIEDQIKTIAAMPEQARAAALTGLPDMPLRQQAGVRRTIAQFRPPE
ncbi:hypothetical protein ACQP00_06215 [Dactylosporangium sp. CS-047395]|uniref:hypothetical protein n=1 Tax=Dactylosporangium sp. CS-047395 TaxID=3239936 RepID=UPI003D89E556